MEDVERKIKKSRRYDKLPVVICEWHHHILSHIHRAIGSLHLPENGLKLLHFDSHPDLTFPMNLTAESCFERDTLYDSIEIADWILPLVYENHVNKVVWMKPPWADQIQDGNWSVKVGESKENKSLRISCKEDYFLEELLYDKQENLDKPKDVRLQIKTLKSNVRGDICQPNLPLGSKDEEVFMQPKIHNENDNFKQTTVFQDNSLILDIDLDFFSTYNPFILRRNKEHFDELADIYKFTPPESSSEAHIEESLQRRKQQLVMLQKTIQYFQQNFAGEQENKADYLTLISDDSQKIDSSEISQRYLNLLHEIHKEEKLGDRKIDLELIHFAGSSSELPHHRSTTEEINNLLTDVQSFLSKQPRPSFVTISRSAEDEYTPPDQVEYIQEKVIQMLELLYNDIKIIKDYEIETDANHVKQDGPS